MKKINLVQGSIEWLQYRSTRVFASDIPSILGSSPHKTRTELLREKMGHQKSISDFTQKLFDDGNEWERVVREHLAKNGQVFTPIVVECPENDLMGASLDGMSEDGKTVLEVKYTTRNDIWESVKSGSVPNHFYDQIQFQLFCSGASECLLVVVKDGDMISTTVRSQTPLEHSITYMAAEKFLSEMAGASEAKHLETPDWINLVNLKRMEVASSARLDEIKDQIKELSKNVLKSFGATHLEGGGIRVQIIEKKGSIDYEKIPELYGVILEKYRKKGSQYTKCELINNKQIENKGNQNESITDDRE